MSSEIITDQTTPAQADGEDASEHARRLGRAPTGVSSLRRHAARGTIINTIYLGLVASMTAVKGLIAAHMLTPAEFGSWGVLSLALTTVVTLRQIGINEKFVQQDETDQERAFQKAFTVEAMLMAVLFFTMVALVIVMGLIYGHPELIAPGLFLTLVLPASALQFPLWTFYRRMDFYRQRTLQAWDPVSSFFVTVVLLLAGMGYWSLLLGAVVGAWAGAIAAVRASYFHIRLVHEKQTLKRYISFSYPLLIAAIAGIVMAQSALLAANVELGLAGAGALTLAALIVGLADRVDAAITQSIYPAICAVKDRGELLQEAFIKSNRLDLMWGIPFGVALALFAEDFVVFVLGGEWQFAVGLLQAMGIITALHHIGFNWEAFYRAKGVTWPVAVVSVSVVGTFCAIAIPLFLLHGIPGFIVGFFIAEGVAMLGKAFFVTRLFPGFPILRYLLRALAPTAPAVLAVVAVRQAGISDTAAVAVFELTLYLAVTAAATLMLERELIREGLGYLRRRQANASA